MTMMSRRPIVSACAALWACASLGGCGSGGERDGAGMPSPTENAAGIAAPGRGSQASASPPLAFATCSACHAVTPGRNSIGPSLAGVWQRRAGSMAGYAYSDALAGSAIVWDAQTLDRWLQGPMRMVPGTKMAMGLPNPEARKAVIDYLETLK